METVTATPEHKLQTSMVQLPEAQYAHPGAETEWWWHIGTLVEKSSGRKFGFEINGGSVYGAGLIQICLTDVQNNKHYQAFETLDPCPSNYAESHPSNPWFVKLEAPANNPTSKVHMTAPQDEPTNMHVKASFSTHDATVEFDLQLTQEGAPLLVWGDGCHVVHKGKTAPLQRDNFYYSLTNLKASGTITLNGGTPIEVEGTTWMDHEFGAFPPSTKWILQDLQLENGVSISNTVVTSVPFTAGKTVDGMATVLQADGTSVFIPIEVTPSKPFAAGDYTYFEEFKIEIDNSEYGINAEFVVHTLVKNQIFLAPGDSIYEGIGGMTSGTYNGHDVTGTVWIEQNLAKTKNKNS